MKHPRSIMVVMLAFVALLLGGVVAPATAQEDAPATVQEDADSSGRQPAVVIAEDGAETEEPAWTFRFLVPTLLVISVIVLVITVLNYGIRVRGRYRVVR